MCWFTAFNTNLLLSIQKGETHVLKERCMVLSVADFKEVKFLSSLQLQFVRIENKSSLQGRGAQNIERLNYWTEGL